MKVIYDGFALEERKAVYCPRCKRWFIGYPHLSNDNLIQSHQIYGDCIKDE